MKTNVVAESCLLGAIFLAAVMSFPSGAFAEGTLLAGPLGLQGPAEPTGSAGGANPPFSGGTHAFRGAFDGANIWIAKYWSNTVTKLRASDGAVEGTFAVGTGPVGVAFDGANIWVANSVSNNVTKLRARDGAVEGTFDVGRRPGA